MEGNRSNRVAKHFEKSISSIESLNLKNLSKNSNSVFFTQVFSRKRIFRNHPIEFLATGHYHQKMDSRFTTQLLYICYTSNLQLKNTKNCTIQKLITKNQILFQGILSQNVKSFL